jgi:hypothetical protein
VKENAKWVSAAAVASLLTLQAIGCGSGSPPAPESRGADFAGVWQGEIRVTACSGDRHCSVFIGANRPFVLRLAQAGSSATGVLTIGTPPMPPGAADITVNLAGVVASDGTVTLSGAKPAASSLDSAGDVEVQRFVVRRSAQTGLSGTLDYVIRYTPSQNFETLMTTRSAEIASATRIASEPFPSSLSMQGHWVGMYVVRACTVSGWPSCIAYFPDRTYAFDLMLMQTGGTVSGSLNIGGGAIPVNGTVSSNMLTLQGSATFQGSGGFDVVSLISWATTTTAVGEMQGSFSYVRESHFTVGVDAGTVKTVTYNLDLVSVVLVP